MLQLRSDKSKVKIIVVIIFVGGQKLYGICEQSECMLGPYLLTYSMEQSPS